MYRGGESGGKSPEFANRKGPHDAAGQHSEMRQSVSFLERQMKKANPVVGPVSFFGSSRYEKWQESNGGGSYRQPVSAAISRPMVAKRRCELAKSSLNSLRVTSRSPTTPLPNSIRVELALLLHC